ncbi:MAG: SHOCT domain-containing protein [Planctomycetota bacterium]
MSMWKRLRRAVSSNLERFREDPLLRDPRGLAADLETLRTQISLLEGDRRRLAAEEEVLAARIRAALGGGRRSEGLDHAETLSKVRRDIALVDGQLERARAAVARAEGVDRELRGDELAARAQDTVERLERELEARPETSRAPGARADVPEPTGSKTLGAGAGGGRGGDSGPVRVGAEKTLGEETPARAAADEAPSPAEKTFGEQSLSPAPARAGGDIIDELERLGRLREQGILDEDEFARAKKKLLGL